MSDSTSPQAEGAVTSPKSPEPLNSSFGGSMTLNSSASFSGSPTNNGAQLRRFRHSLGAFTGPSHFKRQLPADEDAQVNAAIAAASESVMATVGPRGASGSDELLAGLHMNEVTQRFVNEARADRIDDSTIDAVNNADVARDVAVAYRFGSLDSRTLKKVGNSVVHVPTGHIVHLWESREAASRFEHHWSAVWRALFEHGIRGIAAPATVMFDIELRTVSVTAPIPVRDASKPAELAALPALLGAMARQLNVALGLPESTPMQLHAGIDGRHYLTNLTELAEAFQATGVPRHAAITHVMNAAVGSPAEEYPADEPLDVATAIFDELIPQAVDALVKGAGSEREVGTLIVKKVVPEAMHASGVNMILLPDVLDAVVDVAEENAPIVTAIRTELVIRTAKHLARVDGLGRESENTTERVDVVNRLISTLVMTRDSAGWDTHIAPAFQTKYGTACPFGIQSIDKKALIKGLSLALHVVYDGPEGRFSRFGGPKASVIARNAVIPLTSEADSVSTEGWKHLQQISALESPLVRCVAARVGQATVMASLNAENVKGNFKAFLERAASSASGCSPTAMAALQLIYGEVKVASLRQAQVSDIFAALKQALTQGEALHINEADARIVFDAVVRHGVPSEAEQIVDSLRSVCTTSNSSWEVDSNELQALVMNANGDLDNEALAALVDRCDQLLPEDAIVNQSDEATLAAFAPGAALFASLMQLNKSDTQFSQMTQLAIRACCVVHGIVGAGHSDSTLSLYTAASAAAQAQQSTSKTGEMLSKVADKTRSLKRNDRRASASGNVPLTLFHRVYSRIDEDVAEGSPSDASHLRVLKKLIATHISVVSPTFASALVLQRTGRGGVARDSMRVEAKAKLDAKEDSTPAAEDSPEATREEEAAVKLQGVARQRIARNEVEQDQAASQRRPSLALLASVSAEEHSALAVVADVSPREQEANGTAAAVAETEEEGILRLTVWCQNAAKYLLALDTAGNRIALMHDPSATQSRAVALSLLEADELTTTTGEMQPASPQSEADEELGAWPVAEQQGEEKHAVRTSAGADEDIQGPNDTAAPSPVRSSTKTSARATPDAEDSPKKNESVAGLIVTEPTPSATPAAITPETTPRKSADNSPPQDSAIKEDSDNGNNALRSAPSESSLTPESEHLTSPDGDGSQQQQPGSSNRRRRSSAMSSEHGSPRQRSFSDIPVDAQLAYQNEVGIRTELEKEESSARAVMEMTFAQETQRTKDAVVARHASEQQVLWSASETAMKIITKDENDAWSELSIRAGIQHRQAVRKTETRLNHLHEEHREIRSVFYSDEQAKRSNIRKAEETARDRLVQYETVEAENVRLREVGAAAVRHREDLERKGRLVQEREERKARHGLWEEFMVSKEKHERHARMRIRLEEAKRRKAEEEAAALVAKREAQAAREQERQQQQEAARAEREAKLAKVKAQADMWHDKRLAEAKDPNKAHQESLEQQRIDRSGEMSLASMSRSPQQMACSPPPALAPPAAVPAAVVVPKEIRETKASKLRRTVAQRSSAAAQTSPQRVTPARKRASSAEKDDLELSSTDDSDDEQQAKQQEEDEARTKKKQFRDYCRYHAKGYRQAVQDGTGPTAETEPAGLLAILVTLGDPEAPADDPDCGVGSLATLVATRHAAPSNFNFQLMVSAARACGFKDFTFDTRGFGLLLCHPFCGEALSRLVSLAVNKGSSFFMDTSKDDSGELPPRKGGAVVPEDPAAAAIWSKPAERERFWHNTSLDLGFDVPKLLVQQAMAEAASVEGLPWSDVSASTVPGDLVNAIQCDMSAAAAKAVVEACFVRVGLNARTAVTQHVVELILNSAHARMALSVAVDRIVAESGRAAITATEDRRKVAKERHKSNCKRMDAARAEAKAAAAAKEEAEVKRREAKLKPMGSTGSKKRVPMLPDVKLTVVKGTKPVVGKVPIKQHPFAGGRGGPTDGSEAPGAIVREDKAIVNEVMRTLTKDTAFGHQKRAETPNEQKEHLRALSAFAEIVTNDEVVRRHGDLQESKMAFSRAPQAVAGSGASPQKLGSTTKKTRNLPPLASATPEPQVMRDPQFAPGSIGARLMASTPTPLNPELLMMEVAARHRRASEATAVIEKAGVLNPIRTNVAEERRRQQLGVAATDPTNRGGRRQANRAVDPSPYGQPQRGERRQQRTTSRVPGRSQVRPIQQGKPHNGEPSIDAVAAWDARREAAYREASEGRQARPEALHDDIRTSALALQALLNSTA